MTEAWFAKQAMMNGFVQTWRLKISKLADVKKVCAYLVSQRLTYSNHLRNDWALLWNMPPGSSERSRFTLPPNMSRLQFPNSLPECHLYYKSFVLGALK